MCNEPTYRADTMGATSSSFYHKKWNFGVFLFLLSLVSLSSMFVGSLPSPAPHQPGSDRVYLPLLTPADAAGGTSPSQKYHPVTGCPPLTGSNYTLRLLITH